MIRRVIGPSQRGAVNLQQLGTRTGILTQVAFPDHYFIEVQYAQAGFDRVIHGQGKFIED